MLNVDYKMFYSKYVKMGKNEPSSTAILFMFEGGKLSNKHYFTHCYFMEII